MNQWDVFFGIHSVLKIRPRMGEDGVGGSFPVGQKPWAQFGIGKLGWGPACKE